MSQISRFLNALRDNSFEDEDGSSLHLKLRQGLSISELERYEKRLRIALPNEFKELLVYSDGMSFFGQTIMASEEQTLFAPQGILSFHNWGNGDFDCIAVSDHSYPRGSIIFMNHAPEVTSFIETSLLHWFERVVDEIQSRGTLLHPSDYKNREAEGMYGHVVEELRNVDCELNR